MPIKLDYNNMLAPRLGAGRGIEPNRLRELEGRFKEIQKGVDAERASGRLGFFDLPYAGEVIDEIEKFAEGGGQSFSNLVILGIGGSALGMTALKTALLDPFWNDLDDEAREFYPRLYVIDNPDPITFSALLLQIDVRRTLFNVISKSGGTAETMSQFLIIRQKLEAEIGDGYRRHILFTTDPKNGVLRKLAIEEGIAALPIPANVGGRFSVLSAVGLLPAAMVG